MALIVRLAVFAELADSPFIQILMGDAEGYDRWAMRIVESGDWKGTEVYYQAPAYPYFLAVIYSVLGHWPNAVRLIQCVLGAASAAMLAHAGRRLFGRQAGIIAGVFYGLYPIGIFYDLTLQKSSLDGFLMSAMFLLLALLAARPAQDVQNPGQEASGDAGTRVAWLWAGVLGVVCGLLTLTRENALALLPLVPLLIVVLGRSLCVKVWAKRLAPYVAGVLLVLVPVAARNHSIAGEWIITTSQAGSNFFIGNNPAADGTYTPLRPGRGSYRYERTDAVELAEAGAGRKLTASEVSSYWFEKSAQYIREQPWSWVGLMARKTLLLFNVIEAGDTEDPYTYADESKVLMVCLFTLNIGVLFGLALITLFTPGNRAREVLAIWAIVGVLGLSIVAFYVFGRYRFPMVPGLTLLAGFGLVRWLDVMTPLLRGEKDAPVAYRPVVLATLALVLGTVVGRLPLLDRDAIKAVTYNNMATHILESGRSPVQAQEMLLRSIQLAPGFSQAYSNMGAAVERESGPAASVSYYRRAVELSPGLIPARLNLIRVLMTTGQPQDALDVARRGLEVSPGDADLVIAAARAMSDLGRTDEAVKELETAWARAPQDTGLLMALGVARARAGDMNGAVLAFGQARQLDPDNPSASFNYARALASSNRVPEAVAILKEHLRRFPSDNAARVLLRSIDKP